MSGFSSTRSQKEEERNRKEKEKRKKSLEKADSGLLHAAACKEKFQPCHDMILLCRGMSILHFHAKVVGSIMSRHAFPVSRHVMEILARVDQYFPLYLFWYFCCILCIFRCLKYFFCVVLFQLLSTNASCFVRIYRKNKKMKLSTSKNIDRGRIFGYE